MGAVLFWRSLVSGSYLQNIYYAATTAFGAAFVTMGTTFARTRVYSVRAGENQFPELSGIVSGYAEKLHRKTACNIYKDDNGIINIFRIFWGRNYVLLNTEIFEIAYLEL